MTIVVAVICGILGLVVGVLLNVAIDARPERKRSVLAGPFPELSRAGMRPASVTVIVATGAVVGRDRLEISRPVGASGVSPAWRVARRALRRRLRAVPPAEPHDLPDRVRTRCVLLVGAAIADEDFHPLGRSVVCAVGAFVAFAVLHLISPRSMGFGDVRLSFLLGLGLGYLGWEYVVLGLFLGFLYGAVIGVLLIVVRLRTRNDHVPFGPFLAAGALTALLWGDSILRGYQAEVTRPVRAAPVS